MRMLRSHMRRRRSLGRRRRPPALWRRKRRSVRLRENHRRRRNGSWTPPGVPRLHHLAPVPKGLISGVRRRSVDPPAPLPDHTGGLSAEVPEIIGEPDVVQEFPHDLVRLGAPRKSLMHQEQKVRDGVGVELQEFHRLLPEVDRQIVGAPPWVTGHWIVRSSVMRRCRCNRRNWNSAECPNSWRSPSAVNGCSSIVKPNFPELLPFPHDFPPERPDSPQAAACEKRPGPPDMARISGRVMARGLGFPELPEGARSLRR